MIAPDLREYVQLIRDGKARSAREGLERILEADPSQVGAYAVLAMASDAEGLYDEAVDQWRRALVLIPDSPAVAEGLRAALRRRLIWRVDDRLESTAVLLAGSDTAAPPAPKRQAGSAPAWQSLAGGITKPTDAPGEAPPGSGEGEGGTSAEGGDARPVDAAEAAEGGDAAGAAESGGARSRDADSGAMDEPRSPALEPADTPWSGEEASDADVDELAAELAREFRRGGAKFPGVGRPTMSDEGLDALIHDLESARIVPDPGVRPAAPEDLETDVDDVVSETLARIYSNQQFYEEAARVYDRLASQQPDRAEEFRAKADEIRARSGT